VPLGKKATEETLLEWPSSICSSALVAVSQSSTVLIEPEMTCVPLGEKATEETLLE
jgi:hypothetical protein